MGTDWVPAAVRDHADPTELEHLVRTHAALHTQGTHARNDVDQRLRALLIIDTDEDGAWPSHRVAVIGHNPLFPPEWRQAAWSTLLPDELQAWSARWQHWYDSVMAGRYRHYLHRLRTWEMSQELAQAQAELVTAARATESRTNAWTRRPDFRRARDLVSAPPPPPLIPAPGPPPHTDAEDRETSGQAACEETVARHRAVLERAAREFSRTVPSRFKRNPRWSPGVEELLPDTWLEEFFAWLDPVVRSGRGLYLWF
ncbi:hypothetical protein ACIBI9_29375 [Nonomuraea sp. NPDC050451]|uniref:hypothetical protein n=1 Tax=Nonomuraea sp. NPDC050451 TaxID=3364364 RepID=UPI00379F1FF3